MLLTPLPAGEKQQHMTLNASTCRRWKQHKTFTGWEERGGGDSSMELLKLIVAEWRQKHGTAIALLPAGEERGSKGLLMPILAGEERGSMRLLLPQPVGGIQQHNTANAHPPAKRVRQQKISKFFYVLGGEGGGG